MSVLMFATLGTAVVGDAADAVLRTESVHSRWKQKQNKAFHDVPTPLGCHVSHISQIVPYNCENRAVTLKSVSTMTRSPEMSILKQNNGKPS